MRAAEAASGSEVSIAALLALLFFLSAAYFHNSGGWNQNARLDAIYAFVEPGPDRWTFRINRFLPDPDRGLNTGDWSKVGESYFANKAPGTILLGIVVYAPLYLVETRLGWSVDDPYVEIANAYVINLFVSILPLCVAIGVFFRWLVREGTTPWRALWITVVTFLATGLFPYATQLWGHPTTAAFVIFALAELRKGTPRSLAWAGAWAGLALCTDYLAGIVVLILGAYCLLVRPSLVPAYLAGGTIPAAIFAGYHQYCFGTPFTSAMHYSNPGVLVPGLVVGLFHAVSLDTAWQLLVGRYRGIFTSMPVLAVATVGWWYWLRRSASDHLLWLSFTLFAGFYVVNAADAIWYGGSTVLARYLIPVFPCMAMALKEVPHTRRWNAIVALLATVSAFNMLVIASVTLLPPPHEPNPLFGWAYGFFLDGQISPFILFTRLQQFHPRWAEFGGWTAFNAGELMGLRGWASLAPLLAVVAALAGMLVRHGHRFDAVAAVGSSPERHRNGR